MPPRTITRDKLTPQFALLRYNPNGTVLEITLQYMMEDSTDPTEAKVKTIKAMPATLPMATALAARLLSEARAEEGL